jgi:hypothetical protein
MIAVQGGDFSTDIFVTLPSRDEVPRVARRLTLVDMCVSRTPSGSVGGVVSSEMHALATCASSSSVDSSIAGNDCFSAA